jgi:hypothetical protein
MNPLKNLFLPQPPPEGDMAAPAEGCPPLEGAGGGKRLLQIALLLLQSIFFTLHSPLSAQCCSPGNPIGGITSPGVNDAGTWKVFANYRYGYAGQYFEGRQPSTTQFIQDGNFNHLGLVASLGLTDQLTVEAETGYFFNKTQRYVEGIIPSQQTGQGITDLNLSVRYSFLRDLTNDWEITSGLGVKVPVGNHQFADQGTIIPRDLQPTTGAFELVHSLFVYKGFLPQKFRTFLLTRLELKGQSLDQYQYGNFFAASLFGSYSLGTNWVFIGQFRGELRGRDSRLSIGNGIPLANGREQVIPTGSRKVFFVPQVSYVFNPELQLSALVELPVYQFYHDKQLANTVAVMLSLGYTFGQSNGLD